jgi:dipeptidyl aminopeptidase/acylaminoacyl peptidase
LIDCPDGACSRPAWSPDSQRLIYERRTFAGVGGPPGPPRLWWYDKVAEDTLAVFSDTQWLGYGVNFSPDGEWISYVAPNTQGIEVYNLQTSQNLFVLSRTGEQAAWSPTNNELMLTQLQLETAEFAIHIVRANLETEEVTNVSGDVPNNDSWPAYSPNGAWVAFTRQAAGSTGGKQLWLMRPDGSEAYPLTDNLDAHHGAPQWSPNGRFLVRAALSTQCPRKYGHLAARRRNARNSGAGYPRRQSLVGCRNLEQTITLSVVYCTGHWRFLFHQRRPARFFNHIVTLAPEVETSQV